MGNSYELDKAVHDRIYAKIAEENLVGVDPRDKPTAIITGGQPGSGRGGITAQAKQEMAQQGGYVLVDSDELRTNHPQYLELMRSNDRVAADLTHGDASKWARRLASDAIANRQNLIIDQTSRNAEQLVALTRKLRAAGYHVELRVMAVKAELSVLRIYYSYENEKVRVGAARSVQMEFHDAAYKGLSESLEAVERAKSVNTVLVLDKNYQRIYENTLRDGESLTAPPGA